MRDTEGNRTCDHCGRKLPDNALYHSMVLDICPRCAGGADPEWTATEILDLRAEVDRLTSRLAAHERNLNRLHGLLDKEGIPDARHTVCDDPECWSLLYHRIKHGLIARIEAQAAALTDALGTKPPSLPLVDLTTGEPLTVEQVLGAQKEIAFLRSENEALRAIRDEAKRHLTESIRVVDPEYGPVFRLSSICDQVDSVAQEVARLNALLTRLQKQVRTDALVNRYRVLCRDIRDAHRGKGKWTLDDYVYRFDRMYETIGEAEEDT